jgi:hypothetical protein
VRGSTEQRVAEIAALAGLIILALALRLPSLDDSLAGDELATNFVVHGFGAGDVFWAVRHGKEATPPLFFALTWLTKGFDDAAGLRLISLLAGLASIPLTYAVGLKTVGRNAATVAAVLVTLSPFQIFYSTEARAYALMMFWCLLATLCLLLATSTRGPAWWVAFALSAAAAMYTHYTTIFVLAVLFGWALLAHRDRWRALLAATAGAVLLFAPWFPQFVTDTGKQAVKNIDLLHPLTASSVKDDLLATGFGHPLLRVSDLPGTPAMLLIAGAVLIGAVCVALSISASGARSWPPSAGLALVLALTVVPPLLVLLYSLVGPTIFVPRILIGSWPGFALALGALVTAGGSALRWVATGLLIGGFAIGAAQMLDADNQRPDYDGVADFIEEAVPPGTPVVELPQPTPGPQTALEAALAPKGEPLPSDRPILELGFPTFADRLELNRQGKPLTAAGPPPSPETIAAQARDAAGNGVLVLVDGDATLDQLRALSPTAASFLAALPPGTREIAYRRFPGVSILPVGVHVLRLGRTAANGSPGG